MFQVDVLCHRLHRSGDPLPDGPDGDVRPVCLVSDHNDLLVGSVPIFLEAALSLDISPLSISSDILWVLLLNQIHDQKFFKQRRASHP